VRPELYDGVVRREVVLIFIDESHFHRDLENGYTWGRIGHRVWRRSCCASLSDRINRYGAFNFSDGQCLIWNEGNCCKEHTAEFLQRVYEWLPKDGRRVVVIWDNAPWHKAGLVQQAGADLGFELIGLSTDSPDLNPIEGLWKWMREGRDATPMPRHDARPVRRLQSLHRPHQSGSARSRESMVATIRTRSGTGKTPVSAVNRV